MTAIARCHEVVSRIVGQNGSHIREKRRKVDTTTQKCRFAKHLDAEVRTIMLPRVTGALLTKEGGANEALNEAWDIRNDTKP